MANSNPIVLNYHDTVLREFDINILKGTNWLTDSIIGFYFQYLEKEVYKKLPVLFISPEVTQCIKSSHVSEVPVFLDPLEAKDKSIIFFPLNNCENINNSGGWHWSLLVFDRYRNIFYHLDSSNNINESQADTLAMKLQQYFNKDIDVTFNDFPTLQQTNGYDCGIHLLCNVDNIMQFICKRICFDGMEMIKSENVMSKRTNLLSLIHKLQKKQATFK